ncbi:MAG: hypothetical protein ABJ242_10260 [Marinomonas sp.]
MRLFILAAALAAFISTPALADKNLAETLTQPKQSQEASAEKADPKPKAEKRICRRIRTDASSRRKTKICMTSAEWRAANQGS